MLFQRALAMFDEQSVRDENSQAGIVITCVAFCVHEQSIILIIVTLSMNNHDYYLKLFRLHLRENQ